MERVDSVGIVFFMWVRTSFSRHFMGADVLPHPERCLVPKPYGGSPASEPSEPVRG